jgi:hypothetical protein
MVFRVRLPAESQVTQYDYIRPDLQPGQWAVFWDNPLRGKYTIARYSHSERTTPFDRHWAKNGEYFAEVQDLTEWIEEQTEDLKK